jgi:hypothetical protein
VIISGIQSWNSPSGQNPGEFIEFFNTTDRVISLENLQIVSRTDNNADGALDVDWELANESPDLTGLSIAPQSFFLIGESGVIAEGGSPDVVTNMDLATAEGGSTERAISIQIVIDGEHMDYLLYGRHDGSDTAAVPPGDRPFDGIAFPRSEVIRNTRGTPSFQEGLLRREAAETLYAGFDVEGFYTDDSLGGTGFPTGVWTSPHDELFGAYTARTSASPSVPPSQTMVAMFQEGADGYAGTVDTFIQENPADRDNDNGNLDALGWDDDDPNGTGNDAYALLQFDNLFGMGAGQIPAWAVIDSATLTYTVFDVGDPGELHEVLIAWDESVSWNTFGGDPGVNPSDYDLTIVAATPGTPIASFNVDVTSSLQAWAIDPASNRGWIVLPTTGTNGVDLRSSEYVTQAQRPKLTVRYLPEPGVLFQLVSGVLALAVLDKRRRRASG